MKVLKFLKSVGIDLIKGVKIGLLVFIGMFILLAIGLLLSMIIGVIALCIAYWMSILLFGSSDLAIIIFLIEVIGIYTVIEIKANSTNKKTAIKKVNYFKRKWNEIK